MELPVYFGKWITVFLTPTNPFGSDPEDEELHDDYTVPQKVRYSLETRPRCSILDTIIKSAGSRIGILADEVIRNHDLRYETWRLY